MTHTPAHMVRATYDTVAADYAAYFPGTEPEAPIDLATLDHFVSLLDREAPVVLDAGCGAGRIARYLADRGCLVAGVDLSPGMLAMARRDHPDVLVVAGSITDLPVTSASADGAVYWHSIIHLPDSMLRSVVSETVRVLRPGGMALFAFQAGNGVRDVGPAYAAWGHDVTLMRYSRRIADLAALLAEVGLNVIAHLSRGPLGAEKDSQAFVLARRTPR